MRNLTLLVFAIIIGIETALLVTIHRGHWVPVKYVGLQAGDPCLIRDNQIRSCLVSLNPQELYEANHQVP